MDSIYHYFYKGLVQVSPLDLTLLSFMHFFLKLQVLALLLFFCSKIQSITLKIELILVRSKIFQNYLI